MGAGLYIKITIAVVLFSLISGGYFYIQALQGRLQAAVEVQQRMEGVITQQKAQMDRQNEDIQKMQEINVQISDRVQKAQKDVTDLNRKFQKRDLALLASRNPSEVEIRVNRGTKDAMRCNELVTGSPLTAEELSGKVINNICSELLDSRIPKKEGVK